MNGDEKVWNADVAYYSFADFFMQFILKRSIA